MISAPYAGPIENVVVVMFERRSYGDVLDALQAAMMPIATFLARQFMLCDGWVVTSPRARANMLTANCAAFGNSERGVIDLEPNVFSALDAARGVRFGARGTPVQNWKVYFHDYSILGNALAYVARCYDDPANLNLANYDERDYPPGARNPLAAPTTTFLQDVAQSVLPAYAFIEPRHGSGQRDPSRGEFTGEQLLLEVYLALRQSRYWERTLLLVTYDGPGKPGARIPSIVISPYVDQGSTLCGDVAFNHASIVKTLWHCFDLHAGDRPGINDLDESAPSLLDHLQSSVVNSPNGDPLESVAC
jgi:phospholipase C